MDELKKAEQTRNGGIRPAKIAAEAAPESAMEFPAVAASASAVFSRSDHTRRRILLFIMALLLVVLAVLAAVLYAGSRHVEKTSSAIASAPAPVARSLLQARTALQQGDLKMAYMAFRRVLAAEADNRAALHGLAEIALSQNQTDIARNYWQRALQADPQDLRAEIGLISLQARQAPQAAEARLQALLAEQTKAASGSAPLHYALGNLYANQLRWPEAQAAFLQSYQHDPEHPDYLFNLAVSCEQLQQTQQARRFYQLALDAAGQQSASFNLQQARQRLQALR
ncbi:MAG: tetratricopeptide repeat protein [Sterolibacterium sp.]|nr:tetratricopeptide repeat protein [Sterolibacterium sp.]